jgi:hypothetical protein
MQNIKNRDPTYVRLAVPLTSFHHLCYFHTSLLTFWSQNTLNVISTNKIRNPFQSKEKNKDRQCTYVTLRHIHVTTVVMETQQYVPLFYFRRRIWMCSVLSWNWFPLHHCRATKYFVLLLTVLSIKYNQWVSIRSFVTRHASRTFCTPYYVTCRLSLSLPRIFPHRLISGTIFVKTL